MLLPLSARAASGPKPAFGLVDISNTSKGFLESRSVPRVAQRRSSSCSSPHSVPQNHLKESFTMPQG